MGCSRAVLGSDGLRDVNYRAISAGKYAWTAVTDLVFAGIGFLLIKQVAASSARTDWVGYVAGGVLGAQAGIWVSKRLWKGED